jgi:hypothetical protein
MVDRQRRNRPRGLAAFVLVGGLLVSATAFPDAPPDVASSPQPDRPRLAGRGLRDVLEELRGQGLNLVYSTELVRAGMKVRREPKAADARALLDELLAPHGLVTQPGPGGAWVVVKRPPAAKKRPSAPADPLQLGFGDRADVPGSAELQDPNTAGSLRFRPIDVLSTPGAVDNVFRALQVMPGITGAGLFETRIAVRGGAPDQNLTVMDGVEIHNPFRLFGAAAGFNPETVARFELLAGAFPAQFGDRLSSLLVVDTREGRRDRSLAGSASASATDASALLEGRLPGPGDGAWLLAGRRTYYDLVAESFLGDGLPRFDDVQLKLAWRLPRDGRLSFTAWRSREDADGDWSDAVDSVVLASQGRNDLLALGYEAPLGGKARLRGVASAYRFEEGLELAVRGLSDTRVSFDRRRGGSAHQLLDLSLTREVSVTDLALRQELDIALSPRHSLVLGGEVHRLDTRWRQTLPADRNDEAANGSSILFGAGLPRAIDSPVEQTRAAAFVRHEGRFGGSLVVATGLRLERPGSGGVVLAPRFQAGLDVGRLGRLKAAAGLHTQSPGYEKLIHSDYFLDLSEANRRALGQERALHLVLGLARTWRGGYSASFEAYYRSFRNLAVGRLESEAERAARLAAYDYPSELAWGLPTEPVITSDPLGGATGRALGALASISRDDAPERRFTGWLAYAWGKAERTAYGRSYAFDYDRRHAVTAVAHFRFSRRLELGITGRAATGLPTTPPRGVRILGARDLLDRDRDLDRDEILPALDESGRLVYVADPGDAATLNSIRLPAYLRIDARLSYAPRGRRGRWLFYVEALNVLDRRNAASYDWDIRLDPGAARPRIEVGEAQDGIPLLPTLGVRVRF